METNAVKGRPPQSELNISLYRLSSEYDDDVESGSKDVVMCHKRQCHMFSPHPEKSCGTVCSKDSENSDFLKDRLGNTGSGEGFLCGDTLEYSDSERSFIPRNKNTYTETEINVFPGNKQKYSHSDKCQVPKNTFTHKNTDRDRTMIPGNKYDCNHSEMCVVPGDRQIYMNSDDYVFPGNEYETIDCEGSVFPETDECINSEGFVFRERVYPDSETTTFVVNKNKCLDSKGRVLRRNSDENVNSDKYLPGAQNSELSAFPGNKYTNSEECDFPGNKYVVQPPAKRVIRSQFDHLWDASASEIEGMESGLHMWMNESGSTGSSLAGVKHRHSAMWMTCQSLRGFENTGFEYPDHVEGVRDEDFSFYTDGDGNSDSMATKISDDSMGSRYSDDSMTSRRSSDESMTSPRREEERSEVWRTNTIGQFATRRLSQTLLKMGVNHNEGYQISNNKDSSVRMTNHVKTHVSRDYMQSFVTGMVVVEVEGKPVVVVADQINQCVKAFYIDTEGHHDWMRLCNWPSSITTLGCRKEQYVVVNIPFPHHIDIVRVSPRLQIVHKIKMLKEYFCVASLDNNTLVASSVWEDPPTIDILKLSWRKSATLTAIRSIVVQKSFLSLCNDPMYVNTTNHRRILLLDWESSGFVCIDEFGALKFKYEPKSSQQTIQPHSVTCDSRDFVYVTDAEQNRVVQLTKNGEFLRDVLTVEHGLDEPRHVAIDSRGSMYVSQFNGDVKVFALNPPLVTKGLTLFQRLKSCFS